jgi:hypothetical protein
MSLVCEISGEPLLLLPPENNDSVGAVVVTPSGRVCRKSLLLSLLVENGHIDLFVSTKDHPIPLFEDQLITLQLHPSSRIVPPRLLLHNSSKNDNDNDDDDTKNKKTKNEPSSSIQSSSSSPSSPSLPSTTNYSLSSFSHVLHTLQKEYDADLLELFETRKLLHETQQQLTQSLYQNDDASSVDYTIPSLHHENDSSKHTRDHEYEKEFLLESQHETNAVVDTRRTPLHIPPESEHNESSLRTRESFCWRNKRHPTGSRTR